MVEPSPIARVGCATARACRRSASAPGTWASGATRATREVAALRAGIDLGMTLVDTAEMYGDGGAEQVVGRAIAGSRDDVFVVSKVLSAQREREGTVAACERSLARLGTDRIDLYLLHWRGRIPLAETVAHSSACARDGKIVRWGVSNFDVGDMEELFACAMATLRGEPGALQPVRARRRISACAAMPRAWRRHHGVLAVASGRRCCANRKLATLAASLGVTPAQLALAWLLAHRDVIAIPQSSESSST